MILQFFNHWAQTWIPHRSNPRIHFVPSLCRRVTFYTDTHTNTLTTWNMLNRNMLTHTSLTGISLFFFPFPLSASVVSTEEMDRQQPTSPEEKKVNLPDLLSPPVTASAGVGDSQRPCRRWKPGWLPVLQSHLEVPTSPWANTAAAAGGLQGFCCRCCRCCRRCCRCCRCCICCSAVGVSGFWPFDCSVEGFILTRQEDL